MAEVQASTTPAPAAPAAPKIQTKKKVGRNNPLTGRKKYDANGMQFFFISLQAYVSPIVSLIAGGVAGGVEATCTVSTPVQIHISSCMKFHQNNLNH